MARILACITIDTEPDSDYRWNLVKPFKFRSVTEGIPLVMRPIFDKHKVNPVYLTSPSVAKDGASIAVLKSEIKKGAEIGAHLHCEEFDQMSNFKKGFACSAYSDEVELKMCTKLHEQIKDSFGFEPVSFRAGRFGADINTMKSLAGLGYKVDSSVTPGIDWTKRGGPNFKDFPSQPYFINVETPDYKNKSQYNKILEVPITIDGKRLPFLGDKWYFYRWLRPSHMTLFEMKALVKSFIKKRQSENVITLCLMFHSVEVIPGSSPYVRDGIQKGLFVNRLSGILKYMGALGVEFVTLRDVYNIYEKL